MGKDILDSKYINVLQKKKIYLLDMDGTIYNENKLFDGVIPLLNNIKKSGGKYIFLTNNSSKSVNEYVKKLTSLGISTDKEEFFTSSQATIIYIKESLKYNNELIYVMGTQAFKDELKEANLNITDVYNDDVKILLVGYDTELNYQKLIDVCKLLNKDITYIATNPDYVCPVAFGFVPDCGSMCEMIYKATKKIPIFIGKPRAEMIELALKKVNATKEETIIICDRLYTDIASGINAKVDTICVLSGETNIQDIKKSEFKPTYILDHIKELLKLFDERI